MPAMLKILLVFAAMLAASRARIPLGAALVAGGLVLNLWAGLGLGPALRNLGRAVVAPELWVLLAVTVLIIEVGRHITRPGNADQLTLAVKRWGGRHGRAAGLMALPAVVGLVPMPAGALFSAPLVEQTGAGLDVRAEWKSAVNYWFRHLWEYWWPLYPGVIVAMSLFDLDARVFMAVQFPYTLVALAAGYLFLIRRHAETDREPAAAGSVDRGRVAMVLLPLVMVVVAVIGLAPVLDRLLPGAGGTMRKLLALLGGLVAAMAVIGVDERRQCAAAGRKPPRFLGEAASRRSLGILVTLSGILIFKAMLEASGLLPEASRDMAASGIPAACVVAALPVLAGFVTGIAVGFTGMSFPLVVGLLETDGTGLTPLATLVLAFGFGYMGMMLSPVHLCFLVTNTYFGSRLTAVYRWIIPCVAVVALYSLAAYTVLASLGW